MRKWAVLAAIAGSLICTQAQAQERAGSAAIGVVAGALILGPVGAIAGGLVGYTAGPEMSRGLTADQRAVRSKPQRSARSATGAKRPAATNLTTNPAATSQPTVTRAPEAVAIAAKPPPSIRGTQPLPPVQTLD